MRIKFNEKYWKISKYVVLSATLIYALRFVVDFIVATIYDFDGFFGGIGDKIGVGLSIMAPVVVAFVLAYLLDPLVDIFQNKYEKKYGGRKKVSKKTGKVKEKKESEFKTRTAGTTIVYLIVIAVLSLIIYLAFGSLKLDKPDDVSTAVFLSEKVTTMATSVTKTYEALVATLTEYGLIGYFDGILGVALNLINGFITNIAKFIASLGGGLFTGFLGFVMAFYVLRDKEIFKHKTLIFMDTFIPEKTNQGLKNVLSDAHGVFSGYIRGQLTDASIYGLMMSIMLSIIGIPYGVIIGIISGFCNLIPYVGAFVAFALAMIAGFFSDDPNKAIYAAIGILILQQIDSLVIVPKVVGESVELSPFLVLFALAVGGSAFGLAGMLFAVPVTATLKIIIAKFVERQQETLSIKKALTVGDGESEF